MKIGKCFIAAMLFIFLTSSTNAGDNKPSGFAGANQTSPSGLSPAPQPGTKITPSPITQTPGIKPSSSNASPPSSSPSTSNSTPKPTNSSTAKPYSPNPSQSGKPPSTNTSPPRKVDAASLSEYNSSKQRINSYYDKQASDLKNNKSGLSSDQYNSKIKSIENGRQKALDNNQATFDARSGGPTKSNSTQSPTTTPQPPTSGKTTTSGLPPNPAEKWSQTPKTSDGKFINNWLDRHKQTENFYDQKLKDLNKNGGLPFWDKQLADRYKQNRDTIITEKQKAMDRLKSEWDNSLHRNSGLPSPTSSPSQPPVSSSPSTKPYSPITPLPKPPASANASGGNKQNWTFDDTLKWNESPEGKAWYKNLKEGISNMGQGRQQDLDNLRKNYKDMKSEGSEAKYWDEYKKINEKWDSFNDGFFAKNQLPNSSNNYQGTQAPFPKIDTKLPSSPQMLEKDPSNSSDGLTNWLGEWSPGLSKMIENFLSQGRKDPTPKKDNKIESLPRTAAPTTQVPYMDEMLFNIVAGLHNIGASIVGGKRWEYEPTK